MRLENVIRFVVALLPRRGKRLCSLFAIKQRKVYGFGGRCYQSVYWYELKLLHECIDAGIKSIMTEALLNAPVITVSDTGDNVEQYENNEGAERLLDEFTVEQSHQFLAKAYDCVFKETVSGQVTMSRCTTDSDKRFACDSYVVGCLKKFRCTVLEMGKEMSIVHSDICVDLLPMLASGVSETLCIVKCTLLYGEDNAGRRDIAQNMQTSAAPKVKVVLTKVGGRRLLGDLGLTLPNVSVLWLGECGDVDVCGLTKTFTGLKNLRIWEGNRLVYSADFKSLDAMRQLRLLYCGEVQMRVLPQLCPTLKDLRIHGCQVSWSDVHSQWPSLQILDLEDCEEVRLSQWSKLCFSLRTLWISVSAVCVDDVDSQWPSLQELRLWKSHLVRGGSQLTEEEARKTLTDILPSAMIYIQLYKIDP